MKLHDPGFTTGWLAALSANGTSRLASRGLYLCNATILHSNLALVLQQTPVQCFKTNCDVSKKDPHVCTLGAGSCCGSGSFEAVQQRFAFPGSSGEFIAPTGKTVCVPILRVSWG